MSLLPIHLGISDHCTVPHRGEYLSKKSETVYPPICGILKLSVQLNQKIVKLPIKIFKQSQNEGISFQAKLKNTTNSHPKFKKCLDRAMGEVRRATSVTVVRLQAICLMERLAHLGPGARAAGERRRVVRQLEERRTREAQAYRQGHMNRGLGREGRAFVP